MKIVSISDTHRYHRHIKDMPVADVLIHAGDITGRGEISVLKDFAMWMKELSYPTKLVIGGNHDLVLAREAFGGDKQRREILELFKECGIIYLQDSSVEINGVKFYGSPWTPLFHSWAWNLTRGKALAEKWALIPDDTNVLITHGPPHGISDKAPRGWFDGFEHTGCEDLLARILELKHLRAHVFGHIHAGREENDGRREENGIQFVNSCICTEKYQATNLPQVFEI